MIIEETRDTNVPLSSLSKNVIVEKILASIELTCPYFKNAISNPIILEPINENKYTQVFVEQLNFQLRKSDSTFLAGNQYSDLFHNTKGIPDFYFYNLEEGVTASALFVVEAKILPSPPPKIREREYVFGDNIKESGKKVCNGGIERFKLEKHGYGLSESGLLAFIESESFINWFNKINDWISNLSEKEANWSVDEKLEELKVDNDFSYCKSFGRINASKLVLLHHFWINLG